ncbi:MAG: hypothetical protein ACRCXZ_10050, partial [Patescibacteria group bacterium]
NSIFIKGFEIKNLKPAQQKVKEFAKTKGLDVTFTSRFGDSELIMQDNLTQKNYFAVHEGETVTLYHIASSYAVDKNLQTSKGYNGQVVITGQEPALIMTKRRKRSTKINFQGVNQKVDYENFREAFNLVKI